MAIRGIDTARTGLDAAETRLDVVSNNVANSATFAFKRSDVNFADFFYQVLDLPGADLDPPSGVGVEFGKGVLLGSTVLDLTQGPLTEGLDLDVAINGPGFFRVVDGAGNVFYTRLGTFQPKGEAVAGPLNLQLGGNVVLLDPPLILPGATGQVTVSSDGQLFQGNVPVGRFQLVRFPNPEGLLQVGDSLYAESPASGPPIVGNPQDPGFGTLLGGFVEGSNVDIAQELIDLISASQAFNLNSQALTTGNEELLTAIQVAQS